MRPSIDYGSILCRRNRNTKARRYSWSYEHFFYNSLLQVSQRLLKGTPPVEEMP